MKTSFCALTLWLSAGLCLAAPSNYNATSGYGCRITGGAPTQSTFQDILPGLDGPFFDPLDSDIQFQNITHTGEVDEGNGYKRLGFTITLQNTGPGYYEELGIEWEPVGPSWVTVGTTQSQTGPLWRGVGVPDTFGWMPDLIPNGTSTRAQAFEVRVPAADRDAAVAEILAGKHLRPVGIELFQFNSMPVAVDKVTDDAYVGHAGVPFMPNRVNIEFSQSTPLLAALLPGQLLVESAYYYALKRAPKSNPSAPRLSNLVISVEGGPFWRVNSTSGGVEQDYATRIAKVVNVTMNGDGTVTVTVESQNFTDILVTATIFQGSKQALDPGGNLPSGNIYRPAFSNGVISYSFPAMQYPSLYPDPPIRSAERLLLRGHPSIGRGFRPLHIPFNDIGFLSNSIKLSGELLLDALHFDIKLRLRVNQPPKASIKVSSKVELTMRIAANANANNSSQPEIDREKDLFLFLLPPVDLPIGPLMVRIQPTFKGKVGVLVNTPTNIVIPMHGSLEAGCVMSYDGSRPSGEQFQYRPYQRSDPLQVTKPLLNDSLALTAAAFAEAGIELNIGSIVAGSPYFGARATGIFTANPANAPNPWWNLDVDASTRSKFSMKLLWMDIGDVNLNVTPGAVFSHIDAGVPVPPSGSGAPGGSPPGPFDPVSGKETRWARSAGLNAGALKLARVAGSSEDVFAGVDAFAVSPPILRIGPTGDVLWAKGSPFLAAQRLTSTPDGGCAFVTGGGGATVVWMDGLGNATAARYFQPRDANDIAQVFYIGAIQAAADGSVFVAGSIATPGDAHDPFLAKYDAEKNLVFFRRYETTTMLENITGMCVHPSGDLILCGISDGGSVPSTRGGLLMRISPAGVLQWATRTLSPIVYNAVTCSPGGTIYTTGNFTRTITLDWPSLLVARHEPANGHLEFAVLVGERMPDTLPSLGATFGEVGQDYLDAGYTAWDDGKSIAWTPNGLVVTGITANLPNVQSSAAVTLCMTERLGLRWYHSNESGLEDVIFDAVPTDEGILTAGCTRRWAAPNGDPRPALFSKLPREGRCDFPGTSKYLQPSVMQLPVLDAYTLGSPTPAQGYQGEEDIGFSAGTQNVNALSIPTPVFTDQMVDWSPPRQPDPGTGEVVSTNFELWRLKKFPCNFHTSISFSTSDPDNDGVSNLAEYAMNLDPWSPSTVPIGQQFNIFGQSLFHFTRIGDTALRYDVEASNDLLGWTSIYTSSGANNQPGPFEVTDPGPIINGRRFYRLRISE